MERIVFVALLVSQVCCEMNLDKLWTSWKTEFNKEYNSESEEAYRRAVWEQNFLEVKKHNEEFELGWHTYSMGTNNLSDMTAEEVKAKLTGLRVEESPDQDPDKILTFYNNSRVPGKVDWVKKGVVTPVKNQGMCGSCWAFSAVGALEAQMKMKMGKLVPLSEQNLVDCSKNGNHGCNGGFMTYAFEYIINNKGIDSSSFYPYEEREGPCRYSQRGIAGYCSGFRTIPRLNETALLHAVANIGPVSVGIHASLPSFFQYSGGIYNDNRCNPQLVDHAVLVVGYGRQKKMDYWLIKNSWGTEWGEKGYMRMARNQKQCGIPTYAAVPTV